MALASWMRMLWEIETNKSPPREAEREKEIESIYIIYSIGVHGREERLSDGTVEISRASLPNYKIQLPHLLCFSRPFLKSFFALLTLPHFPFSSFTPFPHCHCLCLFPVWLLRKFEGKTKEIQYQSHVITILFYFYFEARIRVIVLD